MLGGKGGWYGETDSYRQEALKKHEKKSVFLALRAPYGHLENGHAIRDTGVFHEDDCEK